jgi:hypothetical protein
VGAGVLSGLGGGSSCGSGSSTLSGGGGGGGGSSGGGGGLMSVTFSTTCGGLFCLFDTMPCMSQTAPPNNTRTSNDPPTQVARLEMPATRRFPYKYYPSSLPAFDDRSVTN